MEISKLNLVCEIFGGYAFPSSSYVQDEIPLIRISNVKSSDEVIIDKNVSIKFNERFSNYIIKKQDILIALSGATTGKFGIYNSDEISYLNQRVGLLRANENVNQKYLFYYLNLIQDEILRKAGGVAQPNISTNQLGEFLIPLPPLSVQKEIAEKLDKADALRKKDQELLKQYDELAQAIFIDMFGDPLIKNEKFIFSPLNEVAILNPRKSEISNLDKNTEISFVEMASVSEKGELIKTEKKLLSEVWNGFTYFKNNDVLFAKITPCMENGKGAIAKDLSQGIGFGSTEFHILRPLVDISNSYWIHFLVRNASFRKLAKLNMTVSAGQKRTPSAFFSLKVNLPPISLQNQFADKIQNLEAQKEILKKQAQLSEELFQALLQESFSF